MPPNGYKTITVKDEYYEEVKDYYLERICREKLDDIKDRKSND